MFVVAGLLLAVGIAFFLSPLASSSPDGLERVAMDQGFESSATDHALAAGPLADYGVAGVDDPWLSTGLSGVVGVALCFALAGALLLAVRFVRSRRRPAASSSDVPSAG